MSRSCSVWALLSSGAETIPIGVEVVTNGVGRYDRSIEESIYFAVLGILNGAVDAGAATATVTMTGTDDTVAFRVDADATVGDHTPIRDRIDALDGTLTTTDTTVTGTVPATITSLEPA